MANAIFPKWKEGVMQASSNTSLGGTVRAIFVDTGTYTYSASHQFFSSLSGLFGDGGTARSNGATLGTKTYTSGTFDAADTVFTSVNTSGTTVEGIILYVDSGADGTSTLVAYFDSSITGMPFSTSSGAQVTIAWNASGIFTL